MIEERLVKTHLIISDVHDEYDIDWCGKLINTQPLLKDGMPVFIIISSVSRVEMNTVDIAALERCAKSITRPRGRAAVTTDKARIYLKEANGGETLMCIVTHRHIKTYQQMFDKVGYY